MAIELKLPDMGEEIEDVTISRWLIQEGDDVHEGDIVVEVATDKVDTEVPATASGKLLKANFGEGELVPVDAVIALIGEEGESIDSTIGSTSDSASVTTSQEETVSPEADHVEPTGAAPMEVEESEIKATPVAKRVAAERGVSLSAITGTGSNGQVTKQDVLNHFDSERGLEDDSSSIGLPGDLANIPSLVVRRLAAENNLDLEEIAAGRPLSTLTKYDLLSAIASRDAGEEVIVAPRFAPPKDWQQSAGPAAQKPPALTKTASEAASSDAKPVPSPQTVAQGGEELIQLSRMRTLVAKNTFESYRTAPHVTTWWDVDMSALLAHRKAHKQEYADAGVKLTVTAYFVPAIIAGLRAVPAANASWSNEGVIIRRDYHIGMAVALPMDQNGMAGLIVPVIKNAGDLNLLGIARAVNDLAQRARDGKLQTADLQGGTFTFSNYGTSGSRFQTPIIVQPQAGILGIGAIEKRPVVISKSRAVDPDPTDYMLFKPMLTLGFSYDHRVLDGATADAFCAAVKQSLESW